jgi:formate dehydrogenase (coenzyme F420) beta subunit
MIEQQLRDSCRKLLEAGDVKVIIGYGAVNGCAPYPVFITDPAQVEQLVFNDKCFQNLTHYLTRKDVLRLGKPAIVVKGCDERTVLMLEKEAQLKREDVYVIGMACEGVGQPKCDICDVHMPRFADERLGTAANNEVSATQRYAEIDEFMKLSPEERHAYWVKEFERCVRCYACRQACPLCYCPLCVMDKNRPQSVDTSPHLKGNLAFHITRAFHLAARCIGCEECVRACPVNINLRLLNKSLSQGAEQNFDFRPGMDPKADLVTGSYSLADREDFIQ